MLFRSPVGCCRQILGECRRRSFRGIVCDFEGPPAGCLPKLAEILDRNCALLAELEVTERSNHSMIVTYVDPSADAAIAESADKDFRFKNNLDCPIYIEGRTEGKQLTFTIYGEEYRDPGREVRYESQVLEVINPPADLITADPALPLGYIAVDNNLHVGYRAELWKIVTENGQETSREKINSSSYRMVPRGAVVGVSTEDPVAYEEIMAAIGIDIVLTGMQDLKSKPAQPEPVPRMQKLQLITF